MNVEEYFTLCERRMPENRTALRRTSFALRRSGVGTMDGLCELFSQRREELANLRDIGPQSLAVIGEVIGLFKENKI